MLHYMLLAIIAFLIYKLIHRRKYLEDIPGPPGIPWIGNVFQLDQTGPQNTLYKWAEEYGDIMKVKLFGEDVVIANSQEAIYEMLVKKSDDFAGRASNYRVKSFFRDVDLVLADSGPVWKLIKNASMAGLKQVGEQLNKLNEITMELVEELVTTLNSFHGTDVDIKEEIHSAVSNITFLIVYGHQLTKDELTEFHSINQKGIEICSPTANNLELDFIPFLRANWYYKFRELRSVIARFRALYSKHLERTISHYKGDITCTLDALLKEQERLKSKNSELNISVESIEAAGFAITSAGASTTHAAVYYLVSLLASDQAFQAEAHAEIIKVIGERRPSLNDRFSIAYIESMILELLRFMSHAPVGFPHKTLTQTTLLGHRIPAAVQVWPNFWYLHHDKKLWDDPWTFKPRRFLDAEGQLMLPSDPLRKQFLAFGAGRRVCAGEALARNRLFLFAVVLIQRFKFSPATVNTIDTDPRNMKIGFSLTPCDFRVHIQARD